MSDSSNNQIDERYTIVKTVGVGGMANVYLARDIVLERKVVLKELRGDLLEVGDYAAMFIDEARIVASLNHPNIVRIYDVGLRNDLPFMALEWLEGWDLRMIEQELESREEWLGLALVLRLIADVAHGLHAAHTTCNDQGVPLRLVHRDVSPHNLFVTINGVIKILDFGIAKSTVQSETTGERLIKGKLAYMGPEQIKARSVDRRCDVFALGINMHELLSGRSLFGGLSFADAYDSILHSPIITPSRPRERLPDDIINIVMHALERHPDKRFQSAGDMAEALEVAMLNNGLICTNEDIAFALKRLFIGSGSHSDDHNYTTIALGHIDEQESAPSDVADLDYEDISYEELSDGFSSAELKNETLALDNGDFSDHLPRIRPSSDENIFSLKNIIIALVVLALIIGGLYAVFSGKKTTLQKQVKKIINTQPAEGDDKNLKSKLPKTSNPKVITGRITLITDPKATVFLNNKAIGVTPLRAITLPAGKHKLRFVNRRAKIDKHITVTVPANGTAKRRIKLRHRR
ncbi:MAG: serine/threonine protein kinase [Deltaproteobacteria bacterium]|nr:serine/threonine protein kinase [Deltaproteobacteria bacterium]